MLKKRSKDLDRKLADAQARATGVKKIKSDDVDYTSGKSIQDQNLDLKAWDAKFLEGKE